MVTALDYLAEQIAHPLHASDIVGLGGIILNGVYILLNKFQKRKAFLQDVLIRKYLFYYASLNLQFAYSTFFTYQQKGTSMIRKYVVFYEQGKSQVEAKVIQPN